MTKQSHKSPASEAVQSPPAVELASLESRRSLDITLAASDCLLRVEGRMWTYGEWGCMRVCICACVRPHLYFEKLNLLCYIKDLLPKAWRWQKDFTSEMRVTDPLCTWHALPLASPPPPLPRCHTARSEMENIACHISILWGLIRWWWWWT